MKNPKQYRRPGGSGWIHLVREPAESQGAFGRWYSNCARATDEGARAYEFAAWFEERLRKSNSGTEPARRLATLSLWVHEESGRSTLDMRSESVWRAVEDLLGEVYVTADRLPGLRGTAWYVGRDLGQYDPSLKATGGPNLLLARCFSTRQERVTDLWMPRREERLDKLAKAGRELEKVVEEVRGEEVDLPRLDETVLPRPPREDGRFSRTVRDLDPAALETTFGAAREEIDTFHDATLSVLQKYLSGLQGVAYPLLEDNKRLAQHVLDLADRYAAKLFFRTTDGDVRQVRVRALPLGGRAKGADTPAGLAGKFSIYTGGATTKSVTDVITFPLFVAARDQEHAERLFAQLDEAEQTEPSAQ